MALTPEAQKAARDRFFEQGISITEWARDHQFDVHLVYSVLSGRSRATRGESHRIAVAFGLKGGSGLMLVGAVHKQPQERLFTTTNGRSAASALGARLAAQLMAAYSALRPETIRALKAGYLPVHGHPRNPFLLHRA